MTTEVVEFWVQMQMPDNPDNWIDWAPKPSSTDAVSRVAELKNERPNRVFRAIRRVQVQTNEVLV